MTGLRKHAEPPRISVANERRRPYAHKILQMRFAVFELPRCDEMTSNPGRSKPRTEHGKSNEGGNPRLGVPCTDCLREYLQDTYRRTRDHACRTRGDDTPLVSLSYGCRHSNAIVSAKPWSVSVRRLWRLEGRRVTVGLERCPRNGRAETERIPIMTSQLRATAPALPPIRPPLSRHRQPLREPIERDAERVGEDQERRERGLAMSGLEHVDVCAV